VIEHFQNLPGLLASRSRDSRQVVIPGRRTVIAFLVVAAPGRY